MVVEDTIFERGSREISRLGPGMAPVMLKLFSRVYLLALAEV